MSKADDRSYTPEVQAGLERAAARLKAFHDMGVEARIILADEDSRLSSGTVRLSRDIDVRLGIFTSERLRLKMNGGLAYVWSGMHSDIVERIASLSDDNAIRCLRALPELLRRLEKELSRMEQLAKS